MYFQYTLLIDSIWHTFFFFFFNDTATTEIYTLSLHDALPISRGIGGLRLVGIVVGGGLLGADQRHLAGLLRADRKSTRLNSSHDQISYAVFCLKKKKITMSPVRLIDVYDIVRRVNFPRSAQYA